MIVDRYTAFRKLFALPGANIAVDGLPEWPASMVGANGFDQGITIARNDANDIITTCNFGGSDVSPFSDEHDWFCSVRTENEVGKPLLFAPVPGKSGSLEMTLSEQTSEIYSNPFSVSTIRAVFGSCFLYVRRRSDGAIQTLDVEKYVAANLAVDD